MSEFDIEVDDGVVFTVPGRPRPKGSGRWVPSKGGGRAILKRDPALEDWTARAGLRAELAMDGRPPSSGSIRVAAVFLYTRPASHFGTGRNAGKLKSRYEGSEPTNRSTADVDKLLRALFDALTGIVFEDDSQVISVVAMKLYGDRDETEVDIRWK